MCDGRHNRVRWRRILGACWQMMLRWRRHETNIFCSFAQKLMVQVQGILVYISSVSSRKYTWWGTAGIPRDAVNIVFQQLCIVRPLLYMKITFVIIFPIAVLASVIKLTCLQPLQTGQIIFTPFIHHNYWIINLRYYVTVRSVV